MDLKRALSFLDASVLITAHNTYYPVDRVPEFWEWLKHQGEQGRVKIPLDIFEEIKEGPKEKDLLFSWLQEDGTKESLVFTEEANIELVQTVVERGYATDLTDAEVEQIGRDPFLIAYALADAGGRCVVTAEASKPSMKRQNRRIPDVCKSVGVDCCDPFQLYRLLGFKTGWR